MKTALFIGLLTISCSLSGQNKMTGLESVATIDGLLTEMLSIITAKEGESRDWVAFRNLFLPTAQFTVLGHDPSYPIEVETVNLDDFIESMQDAYYDQGFEEIELGKRVNEYNGIANVFQSFYGKDSEGSEARGINSYQLVYSKGRWWIVSMLWTFDSNGVEIPKEYIKQ